MTKRLSFAFGSFLVILSCIACGYLVALVADARISGIFPTVKSDFPTNPFEKLVCPLTVKRNETISLHATIRNPTGDTLTYSVDFVTDGFRIVSTTSLPEMTLPGGQLVDVTWVLTAISSGRQAMAIEAISDKDASLPGPFHLWPTSFRESCGILVIDGPFTGEQLFILGSVTAIIGLAISAPRLYGRLQQLRHRWR